MIDIKLQMDINISFNRSQVLWDYSPKDIPTTIIIRSVSQMMIVWTSDYDMK